MAIYTNISEPLVSNKAVDYKAVVKSSEIGGRGNDIKAYVGMIYFDEDTGNIRCVQAVGPEGTVARNTSVLDSTNEAAIHTLIENTDTGLRQLVEDTETKIGTQITESIKGVTTQISNLQKDVDGVKEAVDDETIEKIGQVTDHLDTLIDIATAGGFDTVLEDLKTVKDDLGDVKGQMAEYSETAEKYEQKFYAYDGSILKIGELISRADGFDARFVKLEGEDSSLSGKLGALSATVDEFATTYVNKDSFTQLEQTAGEINTLAKNNKGQISKLTQDASKISEEFDDLSTHLKDLSAYVDQLNPEDIKKAIQDIASLDISALKDLSENGLDEFFSDLEGVEGRIGLIESSAGGYEQTFADIDRTINGNDGILFQIGNLTSNATTFESKLERFEKMEIDGSINKIKTDFSVLQNTVNGVEVSVGKIRDDVSSFNKFQITAAGWYDTVEKKTDDNTEQIATMQMTIAGLDASFAKKVDSSEFGVLEQQVGTIKADSKQFETNFTNINARIKGFEDNFDDLSTFAHKISPEELQEVVDQINDLDVSALATLDVTTLLKDIKVLDGSYLDLSANVGGLLESAAGLKAKYTELDTSLNYIQLNVGEMVMNSNLFKTKFGAIDASISDQDASVQKRFGSLEVSVGGLEAEFEDEGRVGRLDVSVSGLEAQFKDGGRVGKLEVSVGGLEAEFEDDGRVGKLDVSVSGLEAQFKDEGRVGKLEVSVGGLEAYFSEEGAFSQLTSDVHSIKGIVSDENGNSKVVQMSDKWYMSIENKADTSTLNALSTQIEAKLDGIRLSVSEVNDNLDASYQELLTQIDIKPESIAAEVKTQVEGEWQKSGLYVKTDSVSLVSRDSSIFVQNDGATDEIRLATTDDTYMKLKDGSIKIQSAENTKMLFEKGSVCLSTHSPGYMDDSGKIVLPGETFMKLKDGSVLLAASDDTYMKLIDGSILLTTTRGGETSRLGGDTFMLFRDGGINIQSDENTKMLFENGLIQIDAAQNARIAAKDGSVCLSTGDENDTFMKLNDGSILLSASEDTFMKLNDGAIQIDAAQNARIAAKDGSVCLSTGDENDTFMKLNDGSILLGSNSGDYIKLGDKEIRLSVQDDDTFMLFRDGSIKIQSDLNTNMLFEKGLIQIDASKNARIAAKDGSVCLSTGDENDTFMKLNDGSILLSSNSGGYIKLEDDEIRLSTKDDDTFMLFRDGNIKIQSDEKTKMHFENGVVYLSTDRGAYTNDSGNIILNNETFMMLKDGSILLGSDSGGYIKLEDDEIRLSTKDGKTFMLFRDSSIKIQSDENTEMLFENGLIQIDASQNARIAAKDGSVCLSTGVDKATFMKLNDGSILLAASNDTFMKLKDGAIQIDADRRASIVVKDSSISLTGDKGDASLLVYSDGIKLSANSGDELKVTQDGIRLTGEVNATNFSLLENNEAEHPLVKFTLNVCEDEGRQYPIVPKIGGKDYYLDLTPAEQAAMRKTPLFVFYDGEGTDLTNIVATSTITGTGALYKTVQEWNSYEASLAYRTLESLMPKDEDSSLTSQSRYQLSQKNTLYFTKKGDVTFFETLQSQFDNTINSYRDIITNSTHIFTDDRLTSLYNGDLYVWSYDKISMTFEVTRGRRVYNTPPTSNNSNGWLKPTGVLNYGPALPWMYMDQRLSTASLPNEAINPNKIFFNRIKDTASLKRYSFINYLFDTFDTEEIILASLWKISVESDEINCRISKPVLVGKCVVDEIPDALEDNPTFVLDKRLEDENYLKTLLVSKLESNGYKKLEVPIICTKNESYLHIKLHADSIPENVKGREEYSDFSLKGVMRSLYVAFNDIQDASDNIDEATRGNYAEYGSAIMFRKFELDGSTNYINLEDGYGWKFDASYGLTDLDSEMVVAQNLQFYTVDSDNDVYRPGQSSSNCLPGYTLEDNVNHSRRFGRLEGAYWTATTDSVINDDAPIQLVAEGKYYKEMEIADMYYLPIGLQKLGDRQSKIWRLSDKKVAYSVSDGVVTNGIIPNITSYNLNIDRLTRNDECQVGTSEHFLNNLNKTRFTIETLNNQTVGLPRRTAQIDII